MQRAAEDQRRLYLYPPTTRTEMGVSSKVPSAASPLLATMPLYEGHPPPLSPFVPSHVTLPTVMTTEDIDKAAFDETIRRGHFSLAQGTGRSATALSGRFSNASPGVEAGHVPKILKVHMCPRLLPQALAAGGCSYGRGHLCT